MAAGINHPVLTLLHFSRWRKRFSRFNATDFHYNGSMLAVVLLWSGVDVVSIGLLFFDFPARAVGVCLAWGSLSSQPSWYVRYPTAVQGDFGYIAVMGEA